MHLRMFLIVLVVAVLATGCGTAATRQPADTPQSMAAPTATPAASPAPAGSATGGKPAPISEEQLRKELEGARFSTQEWKSTNFRIRGVPLNEFLGGGPGKDDIPSIDNPKFETVAQANGWLDDREPVQVVEIAGDARAYPQQILIWHEIVNDTVGGEPVTITY